MGKEKLTLGMILGIITLITLAVSAFLFVIGAITIEDFLLKVIENQVPFIVNVIITLAGLGVIGAILIILLGKYGDRILDYNLLDLIR